MKHHDHPDRFTNYEVDLQEEVDRLDPTLAGFTVKSVLLIQESGFDSKVRRT